MSAKKAPAKKAASRAKPAATPRPPTLLEILDAAGTDAIAELITEGRSYREIAAKFKVSPATLVAWIARDPERSRACAHAREASAQAFDELAVEAIEQAETPLDLAKARELATHYRWRAKSVNPKHYGDKVQVDANLNVNDMTDAEMARRLAEFGIGAVVGATSGNP